MKHLAYSTKPEHAETFCGMLVMRHEVTQKVKETECKLCQKRWDEWNEKS